MSGLDTEQQQALSASVLDEIEDPDEREAARLTLQGIHGVDLDTGVEIDDDPGGAKPEEDPPKPADAKPDADEGGKKDAAEGDDETGKKPEGEADPEDGKPKDGEDDPSGKKDEPSIEDLQKRVRELEGENATLQGKLTVAESGDEIEAEARKNLSARHLTEIAAANKFEETIKSAEEEHGPEVAKIMRDQHTAHMTTIKAGHEREVKVEVDRIRAERTEAATEASQTDQLIGQFPDLVAWKAEYNGLPNEEAQSKSTWAMAVRLDDALRGSPAWSDKSQHDRFEEVVRLVKSATGAAPAPAPADTPKDGEDDPSGKKPEGGKDADDIQKQIEREAAKKTRTDDGPGSLSDLPSGDVPSDFGDKLENMSLLELEEAFDQGRLSPDQVDSYLAKHHPNL